MERTFAMWSRRRRTAQVHKACVVRVAGEEDGGSSSPNNSGASSGLGQCGKRGMCPLGRSAAASLPTAAASLGDSKQTSGGTSPSDPARKVRLISNQLGFGIRASCKPYLLQLLPKSDA